MRGISRLGWCAVVLAGVLPGSAHAEVSQPEYGIKWDRDVVVTVRDGTPIATDIIRPDAEGRFPVIVSSSPYQKALERVLPHGSPYSHRETLPPDFFVPRGYVLIRADTRGTGTSGGAMPGVFSPQEARDVYDVIEWAAQQPWSNGNVGMGGVSYYGIIQYTVASLQPPSLKCILPWEGASDIYRDGVYHGGLLDTGFLGGWWPHVKGRQLKEQTAADTPQAFKYDLLYDTMSHPLDGPYWRSRAANWDTITVPMYSVGNWEGLGLHLRGNVEAYLFGRMPHKKLRVHVGGHTDAFFSAEGQTDMLRWYDHWLKGNDTGLLDEPPVKFVVRNSGSPEFRFEQEWPLARTEYTKLYLDSSSPAGVVKGGVNDGALRSGAPAAEHVVQYDGRQMTWRKVFVGRPIVTYVGEPFTTATEMTGHPNLVLSVSADAADMDLFVKLQDHGPDGNVQLITKGWLKASRRALDPDKSTAYKPYYRATGEEKLSPGEVVQVHVEIWPTSWVFQPGHRLRVDIAPHDSLRLDAPHSHYDNTYRLADNRIHEGGEQASYLLVPFVPAGD